MLSTRILAIFFWFLIIVVSNIYKGNLIASLATYSPSLPFSTLEEVAADTQYTVLMVNDSSQRTLLEVRPCFLVINFFCEIVRSYCLAGIERGQKHRLIELIASDQNDSAATLSTFSPW